MSRYVFKRHPAYYVRTHRKEICIEYIQGKIFECLMNKKSDISNVPNIKGLKTLTFFLCSIMVAR